MAYSEATSCQAFRIRENIFAFQFHFEVTPENIAGFISEVEPELVTGNYSQNPSEMLALAGYCVENNQIFNNILNEIQIISQKRQV
jgi:GMP synthase-like glutamine amidotransferase